MPDSKGLSSWAERDDAFQLRMALKAFERTFFAQEGDDLSLTDTSSDGSKTAIWMKHLKKNTNVESIEQLAAQCRMELVDKLPKKNGDKSNGNNNNNHMKASDSDIVSLWSDKDTLEKLSNFLPSPIGLQCLKIAEQAVQRVENGGAKATYVHRGSKRGEKWLISDIDSGDDSGAADCWTLDVDCAGFIRNVIKSVTGSDFLLSLSDRDYMRAKDFYNFIERLDTTVDKVPSPVTDENTRSPSPTSSTTTTTPELRWCRVDDLRNVLAGDIIVYRAKGGAAGGSVFVKKVCLEQALKDVKTAELYDIKDEETGADLVDVNVAKMPEVKEWVSDVMAILSTVGITEIEQLRGDFQDGANDEDNDDNLQTAIEALEREEKLSENTVSLLQEVLSSRNGNTGHIMFAAGPAERTPEEDYHIWRVPVYHSTGVGPKKHRGVKRDYKRFEYSEQYQKWTRGGPKDDVEGDGHIEVVVGRMCP